MKYSRRIKKHDLLPWFLEDHEQLPASYLKSCQKFFNELQASSSKRQAASDKPRVIHSPVDNYEFKQAASLTVNLIKDNIG